MQSDSEHELLARNRELADQLARANDALRESDERCALATHSALHDRLTGLPNRALFLDRLDRAGTAGCAVLFLNMDRFTLINGSLGHPAGDQLLIEFVRRLSACLRSRDTLARVGGDEFTILLEGDSGAEAATQVAELVLDSLKQPFYLGASEVFVTASIGIAVGGEGAEAQNLLRDADTALHRAKAAGRNRHQIFDAAMHEHAVMLLRMENDLRRAVERGEFELHYQPIIQTASEQVSAFEALIRWRHPERGLVMPGDFIPVAEETGIITPIGQWVLNEACRQAAEWRERFPAAGDLAVAVNLSPRQFAEPRLFDQVRDALARSGLPPRCLILEITESAVMADAGQAAVVLKSLKSMGIRVNIDDFGTGYSSLAFLHNFPVDSMKIDRSFVARFDGKPENSQIVRTIVTLAHNLNMTVTAEGVETEAQFAQVRQLGAENSQGYLFSKPLAADAATELLRDFSGIKSSGQLRASA